MRTFAPSSAYQPERDIRLGAGGTPPWLEPLLKAHPPNSVCWVVVLPRRAGKTWLAAGIEHQRPESTQRVDLRGGAAAIRYAGLGCLLGDDTQPELSSELLLLDEPGFVGPLQQGMEATALVAGLARVRRKGVVPVLFATPLEHALVIKHLGADASKDVVIPPALTDAEIIRLAARAPDWAPLVVESVRSVDPSWVRTPFLLELVLGVAEEHPRLRDDVRGLLTAATDEAIARHEYLDQVLANGLSAEQRSEVRADRWRRTGVDVATHRHARLLAATRVPDDPVVTSHLPAVLRLHHISDLHIGGNLRKNVDAKDKSAAGRRLASLAGDGTPLESYLRHVERLAEEGRAPHLLVVTGDLVNRPSEDSGTEAIDWLSALEAMLAPHPDIQPDDPRIVLTGGNHDVSWDLSMDPRSEERHVWFGETFARYPHPELHRPDCRSRRLYVRYPGAGLRIALLGSAESGGEVANDSDREALALFRDEFQGAQDDAAVADLIRNFQRLDPGIVARPILDRLTADPGYLTLAGIHHPLSPVPAVEVAPYAGIVNAGQVKSALSRARTALVLHGHTHQAFMSSERQLGAPTTWTMRIAGAPALASAESNEQNGYNEIFIGREGADHAIFVRPVRLNGGQWEVGSGAAFRPGEQAECGIDGLLNDPTQDPRGRRL